MSRLYAFQNFYLASIHAGIQTAHSIAELSIKTKNTDHENQYMDWALNHKTIIILNGGMQCDLYNTLAILEPIKDIIPFACFHEELDALNGALTNVCCILPERYYECAKQVRQLSKDVGVDVFPNSDLFYDATGWKYTMEELAFINHLNTHRLMG